MTTPFATMRQAAARAIDDNDHTGAIIHFCDWLGTTTAAAYATILQDIRTTQMARGWIEDDEITLRTAIRHRLRRDIDIHGMTGII